MIHVIATVQVAEGQQDAFLDIFRGVAPAVLNEEGCLEYGPTIDVDTTVPAQGGMRPDTVTIVEKWESMEALEAHLIAPHMLEYRTKVKDLVQSVSLQILEPV